jgi:uncharacterized OB-fold protein
MNRCKKCGRVLTDPVSIQRSVGPECAQRREPTEFERTVEALKAAAAENTGFGLPKMAVLILAKIQRGKPLTPAQRRWKAKIVQQYGGVC